MPVNARWMPSPMAVVFCFGAFAKSTSVLDAEFSEMFCNSEVNKRRARQSSAL